MRRHRSLAIASAIAILILVVLITGVTEAFGTDSQLRESVGGLSDGAASDTFWDSAVVDIPGVSVTALHCHGKVQFELQLGATGPTRDNPCYAAMGAYSGESQDWGTYILLPGDMAVYRISENSKPWRYCIAKLIRSVTPQVALPQIPC